MGRHVFALAQFVARRMDALRHESTHTPVALLYGNHSANDMKLQGGTVAFNLRRGDGSFVGYAEVQRLATLNNIHMRVC